MATQGYVKQRMGCGVLKGEELNERRFPEDWPAPIVLAALCMTMVALERICFVMSPLS